jgi:thiamine transport system ATP-binding protein
MLHVENLTYAYRHDGTTDTYQYDLTVHAGNVIGILGSSGSGKSTLLDLLAGFLKPDSGGIDLDGGDLIPLPPEKRPMTILFQHHNLFEHLTATQNILIGIHGNTRGTPEELERVQKILSDMGIADQADKIVSRLSGGQQQRVALARVLLRDRPILLLDEPFTGLDHPTRIEMLHLVRTLTTRQNIHTLMVTHERADCDAIADRVYQMEAGKLDLVSQEVRSRRSGS